MNTENNKKIENIDEVTRLEHARRIAFPMIAFLIGATTSYMASWDIVAIVFAAMFIVPYFMPRR